MTVLICLCFLVFCSLCHMGLCRPEVLYASCTGHVHCPFCPILPFWLKRRLCRHEILSIMYSVATITQPVRFCEGVGRVELFGQTPLEICSRVLNCYVYSSTIAHLCRSSGWAHWTFSQRCSTCSTFLWLQYPWSKLAS